VWIAEGTTTLSVAVDANPTRSDPGSPRVAIDGISSTPARNTLPASVSSTPRVRRLIQ
jgi:hypothetical protein